MVIDRNDLLGHSGAGKAGVYVVGSDTVSIINNNLEGNSYGVLLSNSEASNSLRLYGGNHFETNTVGVEIRNTSGGENLYGLTIDDNFFYEDPVTIGTDNSGTLITGGKFKGNTLTNANMTTIGGSKLRSFEVGANTLAGTSTITFGDHHLSTDDLLPAHKTMPMYASAPAEPSESGDSKGDIGDLRWSTERGWINTSNANWRQWQISKASTGTALITLPTGATPSVQDLEVCSTNNSGATNITSLGDGYAGQRLTVVGLDGGNTTFIDGGNLYLAGDFLAGDYDVLELICVDGTKWAEESRSNN